MTTQLLGLLTLCQTCFSNKITKFLPFSLQPVKAVDRIPLETGFSGMAHDLQTDAGPQASDLLRCLFGFFFIVCMPHLGTWPLGQSCGFLGLGSI